jgi:dienelactone hydrolase
MSIRRNIFVAAAALSVAATAMANDNDCTPGKSVRSVKTTLASTPALLRIPRSITRPPIILWHGYGPPASESALMDALPLDEIPAVKVYLGLPLFGERLPAAGAAELGRRQSTDFASLLFEPSVLGAADELPAVLHALQARGCSKAGDKVGLFGFSAGGAAVLYALAEHEIPVSAAVTINASTGLNASVAALERATQHPYAWTEHAREIAKRSDAPGRAGDIASGKPPPALLIVHGEQDAMLTPQVANALNDALAPYYEKSHAERRLQLSIVPGVAHTWADASHIEALRKSIAAWFERYLDA